jgi:glyceraldehyde-3-phosphate dehydrogenase/erythrose-4-phosphate dehydrogenase
MSDWYYQIGRKGIGNEEKFVTVRAPAEVNAALKAAAQGELKRTFAFTEDPVVSNDMLHNSNSLIVDAGAWTEKA